MKRAALRRVFYLRLGVAGLSLACVCALAEDSLLTTTEGSLLRTAEGSSLLFTYKPLRALAEGSLLTTTEGSLLTTAEGSSIEDGVTTISSTKDSATKTSTPKTSGTKSTFTHTRLRGYVKSFVVLQQAERNPALPLAATSQSQNSVRLMLDGAKHQGAWQVHYELSPVFLSRSAHANLPTFSAVSDRYRLSDLEASLTDETTEKHQLYQNLDRFNYQHRFASGDLTLGRQAVSFGLARIINPTDVFLPFDVRTFNQEYRKGVDALRFQAPLGDLGEADFGIVLGDAAQAETSAAFLQLRGNLSGKDLEFSLLEFAQQRLVGAGLQTALGNFGFWFEAARVTGDATYTRLSTGIDYAFTEHSFGMLEYHRNGAGSKDAADYAGLFNTTPYQRGGVFLLGRDYLIPVFSLQVSPLWNLALQSIINLNDASVFLTLSAEYNLAEDLYMDFGYYRFSGDELRLDADDSPAFQSEYGSNPDTAYISLRFYF